MASSSSSSSSSSSQPKKDIAASAGEIASSFFDRLKKSTSERAKNSTNSTSTSSSSSSPAAELIANLAQNLIVNATSNSSTSNAGTSGSSSNSSAGSILFSKLLGDQKKTAPKTLKIYDDDNLDDSDFDISKISAAPAPSKLRSVSSATSSSTSTPPPLVTTTSSSAVATPTTASVSIDGAASSSTSLASLASSVQSESSSLVTNSKSELDMNKLSVFQNKPSPTTNEPEPKMSTSSSLHLISSVIDDFMKKDIAHTVVDTATNEAVQLRNKLWTKKKSIESSIENMKAKAKLTKSVSEIIKDPSLATNDESLSLSSSIDQKTPEGSFKRKIKITLDESMKSLSEESPNEIATESSRRSISQVKTARSLSETVMFDADDEEQPQVAANLKEKIANDNNEMITSAATSAQTNQGGETTREQQRTALDKKLITGAALVMIIALSIIYKNISLVVLTFFFGLSLGSLATALVLYLAQKFNLIRSFGTKQHQHATSKSTTHDETTNSSNCNTSNSSSNASSKSSIQQIASLLIQTPIPKENKNFNGVYKGWMNELREVYDPEKYFLNKTRSVYLNLDGIMLRIQTTTSRVAKRALPGEHIANVTFNEQRHYDLTGCEVIILPAKLCRKRFWSKKYPICLKRVKLLNSKGLGHSNSIASDITSIGHSSTSTTPREENNNTLAHEPLEKNTLILFARTDREKEEWYNLFRKASAKKLQDSMEYLKKKRSQQMLSTSHSVTSTTSGSLAVDKIAFEVSNNKLIYKVNSKPDLTSATTSEATNKNIQSGSGADTSEQLTTETNALSTTRDTQTDNGLLYDSTVAFINTFMIRAFADFFTHKHWIDRIQNKIQNKLSMIRVPYFMEELKITGLDLGTIVPIIKRSSEPWCDEKGLWVHLEIDYSGGLQMSLSTKLNLMKLKSNSSHHQQNNNHHHHHSSHSPSNLSPMSTSNSVPIFTFKNEPKSEDASVAMIGSHFSAENSSASASRDSNMNADASSKSSSLSSSPSQGPAPIEQLSDDKKKRSFSTTTTTTTTSRKKVKNLGTYDSNEEDSPESSGDEYVHNGFGDEENKLVETANASKKFLGLVNKIAASNYFQKATENKYIKMAMENVSNCQLLLNVELKKISGTLALNIPPHPSDRIWYGFVTNPQMVLVATPQVGEKEVSYSAITDWIADKLKIEFQVLVFPNMDDLYIPILNSEINI